MNFCVKSALLFKLFVNYAASQDSINRQEA